MIVKETKRNGFSLIELIVVVVIMAIILSIAIPQMSKYIEKYNVEKEINSLQSTLISLRYKAMNSGIPYGIRFDSSKQYTTFEFNDKNYNLKFDGVDEEANKQIVKLKYDIHKKGSNQIAGFVLLFDKNGFPKNQDWGIGNLTLYINYEAAYNCLTVSSVRIETGVWKDGDCKVK